MTTKPYPFQTEGVRLIEQFNGRCLLADSMGLGKTLQSLLYLHRNKDIRPAIVVCPASLKWQWEIEAEKHIGMLSEILEGRKSPTKQYRWFTPPLLIINYDILKDWVPYLRGLNPKCVIFDEAHYLQSRSSQRTKAAQKLVAGMEHVLCLTGTPITNRPAELWPILNILHPKTYPSFFQYAFRYCAPKKTYWGWDFRGAARLPELHKKLHKEMMIRRLKEDVMTQLPPKRRSVLLVDIANRKEYDHAERDFLGWLAKRDPSKLYGAARAEKMVRIGYLQRLVAKLKMNSVEKWIDNFLADTDEKLVLFGVHKAILNRLHDRYRAISVLVNGEVVGRRRQQAVDQFQGNKKTRMFLGNIKAAGVGLNLTAASHGAFVEFGWTPGGVEQAIDRLHRIGQKKNVLWYFLVARNTLEEDHIKLLHEKQKVLKAALDGKRNTGMDDLVDELIRRIQKGKK